jgi:aspartate-semialdehyde dehydrogenase
LQEAFGIEKLFVTTLQAISGAGYPGVSALDITDNVVPHISGEEDKMETEPQKILGTIGQPSAAAAASDGSGANSSAEPVFLPASFAVSAQCNRVAVLDGHQECVSIKLSRPPTGPDAAEKIEAVLRDWQSEAQRLRLPSAPARPIHVHSGAELARPQPRLDRDRGGGFVVTVGRVRPCPILDFKFALCSHNTVLGAAGGSILNAELAVAKGLL